MKYRKYPGQNLSHRKYCDHRSYHLTSSTKSRPRNQFSCLREQNNKKNTCRFHTYSEEVMMQFFMHVVNSLIWKIQVEY